MPAQEPIQPTDQQLHRYAMTVDVFGPIRPDRELRGYTQRALKARAGGRDYFTDITLHDARNLSGLRVEYTVTAPSPTSAERAGAVYLSQLCDLLSVVTRAPVWFHMTEDDARDERIRMSRRAASVDRILTDAEWTWVTGMLVFLREKHSAFLAASSWHRKGLTGTDSLEVFCCFWRVIERLAEHYAFKMDWTDEERRKSDAKKCVQQLTADLFKVEPLPRVLGDTKVVKEIVDLRNKLSHGKIPITLEVIDCATEQREGLEEAAYAVLQRIREEKLVLDEIN